MKIFKTPFAVQGDRVAVPDEMQSDGSVSYTQGYSQDYEKEYDKAGAKDIERSKMNAIFHDITDAIGKGQNTGIYPWIKEAAPYTKGSFVYYNKEAFYSLVDNNSDTPVDGAKWRALSKKQDALTFTGTGDVVRKSVTDALDRRVTTAQSSADSALKEAQSKQGKLEFVGTGNVVRKSVTDALGQDILKKRDLDDLKFKHIDVTDNNDSLLLKPNGSMTLVKSGVDSKTIKLPDKNGTLALLSDIPKNISGSYVTVGGSVDVKYTNELSKSIFVVIELYDSGAGMKGALQVDDLNVCRVNTSNGTTTGNIATLQAIVPPSSYYTITQLGPKTSVASSRALK